MKVMIVVLLIPFLSDKQNFGFYEAEIRVINGRKYYHTMGESYYKYGLFLSILGEKSRMPLLLLIKLPGASSFHFKFT